MIFNNSIPKITLGVYLICLIHRFVKRKTDFIKPNTKFKIGYWSVMITLLLLVSYNLITASLIMPHLVFYFTNLALSSLFLILSIFCLVKVTQSKNNIKSIQFTLLALFAIYSTNEYIGARFNYPYLSPGQREAFIWLKYNTAFENTLVLTHSKLEIDHKDEMTNFDTKGKSDRPSYFSWSYYWLPIISERYSIFNRGVFLNKWLNTSINISGNDPDLINLDWSYFNVDTQKSCEIMRSHGVTHVYYEGRARTMLNENINSRIRF